MNKQLIKESLLWGFILWFIGYVLGIILFPFVPASAIGLVITPIGLVITLFVLFKKLKSTKFSDYLIIALSWTIIAIVLDYLLLVKVFHSADGYYKLDVYFYYASTLTLPLLVAKIKSLPV